MTEISRKKTARSLMETASHRSPSAWPVPAASPDRMLIRLAITALVLLFSCLSACRQWSNSTGQSLMLPAARLAPDAAVVEVAFVTLPTNDPQLYESFWHEVDETVNPVDRRTEMWDNGLRWGIVGPAIPDVLQSLLARTDADADDGAEIGKQLDWNGPWSGGTARRLQLREGRAATIVVRKADAGTLTLLLREEGSLRGMTLDLAECQLELTSERLDGGDVQLTLLPRIAHGAAKPKMVGHQGTWIVQSERDQLVLEELSVQTRLGPGQILVLGASLPMRGAGGTFFAQGSDREALQRILLIRLASTPPSELFDSSAATD